MRPKDYALLVLLLLAAVLAGRAWGERMPAVPAVEARAGAQRDGLRWEYCAVTKAQFVGSSRGGAYWINYFRGDRVQVETVETGPTGNALSKAVAKLGEENWEMVGEGPLEIRAGVPGGTPTALFFKRRLVEER